MPQEPKRRHSKTRKRVRRAAIMLKSIGLIQCKHCKEMILPHQVCPHCGYYGLKQVSKKTEVKVTKA